MRSMVHLYRIEAIILNANQKEKKKDCVLYTHTQNSVLPCCLDIYENCNMEGQYGCGAQPALASYEPNRKPTESSDIIFKFV